MAVLRFFLSAVFWTCVVALIFSVCIWFFGPLIDIAEWRPLDGFWERVGTIAGLWVLVIAILSFRAWRRRRRDRALTEDIVAQADPADEALSAELDELKTKLRQALSTLRKSKTGKRHLNELPWYVMIGPPGAGKTTAIANSGLRFPLAEEGLVEAIGGVGGTRNCDWWFTNDAVLIDTAGRYTTQESDAEADNKAWLGFLTILRKYRPRQPINGAMIAISLSDLSNQDHETQMSHARAVRRRILELREQLGIKFPIYVLFTKADLIAGFSEFFERLTKEEAEQVWGFTFDIKAQKGDKPPLDSFDAEFAGLLQQLNAQSLEKMQVERDPARRSLIAGFPSQLASVRQVARDFLAEAFQDSKYEERLPLRGVYFTSGTQEGTPIDRLMMGMARTFGIGRQAIGTGKGTGKSFFITRLLQEVVFPEAGLVAQDDKVERRYRWVVRGSIAASAIFTVGLTAFWVQSFLGNRALVEDAATRIATFQELENQIPGNPIADTDLPGIVPALNILRELPGNPVVGAPDHPWTLGFGLYQGDVLGTSAAQSYRAALNQHMLPRLILRMEELIQSTMDNPDELYELLKVYLMLGGQAPALDKSLIREKLTGDWEIRYPGLSREDTRADLSFHLDVLLAGTMEKIELDGNLVARVQELLTELSLAERLYRGILSSTAATELSTFNVRAIGGPQVTRAFTRSSGADLRDGIPGIYTYAGFHDVFLEEVLGVPERVKSESWVLGDYDEAQQTDVAVARTSRDVLQLYYDDYVAAYNALLADIDIVPLESLSHAAEITNILSGASSPIRNLLTEIADETRLTEDRSAVPTEAVSDAGGALGAEALREVRSRRMQILLETAFRADTGTTQAAPPPGQFVENSFSRLQELVEAEPDVPSQLDDIITQLQEVYRELDQMARNTSVLAPASDEASALSQFLASVERFDEPLPRWSRQIAAGASDLSAEGTRAQLNARWQSTVAPFCAQALAGRYPFVPQSSQDVTIQDFSRAFAPGGLIDKFFTDNLLRYVNTSSRPWTFKPNQADLGISESVLQQFEYAGQIRDTFFAGGPTPRVQFEITPFAIGATAQRVTLDIDNTSIVFEHGAELKPTGLVWPGEFGLGRITFEPPSNTVESTLSRDGPWGWFRLLRASNLRDLAEGNKKRLNFNVGGRIAIFEMRLGSAFNPFNLAALTKFSCPKSL